MMLNDGGHREMIDKARRDAGALPKFRISLPEKIGRFEILRLIGEGGFGTVYQARDPKLDRIVAIKKPFARPTQTHEQTERLVREAHTAAHLKHPHIVRVFEVLQDADGPIIVSEYVAGETLGSLIRGNRWTLAELLALMVKVTKAVDYSHRMGVVHRDLKSVNVLVDEHNEPRIIDFGLARRKDFDMTLTREGQILGTPAYMSPEQCSGADVDAKSDIYSLGVLLYQMVTGELPFTSIGFGVFEEIKHAMPLPPSRIVGGVSRSLDAIVLRCLAKKPDERYATAMDLAQDIEAYLAGARVTAESSSLRHQWDAIWEDTRYVHIVQSYARVLVLEGIVLLVNGLLTALMLHHFKIQTRWPYAVLWITVLSAYGITGRRMLGDSTRWGLLERQLFPIALGAAVIWWGVFLTEAVLGLPILTFAPLIALSWGFLWTILARIFTGKLYAQTVLYGVCFLLMLLLPDVQIYVFALFSGASSFGAGLYFLCSKR